MIVRLLTKIKHHHLSRIRCHVQSIPFETLSLSTKSFTKVASGDSKVNFIKHETYLNFGTKNILQIVKEYLFAKCLRRSFKSM